MIEKYYEQIVHILGQIKDTQAERMGSAAHMVADVIKADGIIYVFGCGHSHLIGLDCFYRAGGLANVSAMLDTDLMLHNGAAKSSVMEKMSGIAESILERYCITEKDLLIVISTSGKNAVPVAAQVSAILPVFCGISGSCRTMLISSTNVLSGIIDFIICMHNGGFWGWNAI